MGYDYYFLVYYPLFRNKSSVHNQRTMLIELASQQAAPKGDDPIQELIDAGSPDPKWAVWVFHLLADGAVIWLIWSLGSVPAVNSGDEQDT